MAVQRKVREHQTGEPVPILPDWATGPLPAILLVGGVVVWLEFQRPADRPVTLPPPPVDRAIRSYRSCSTRAIAARVGDLLGVGHSGTTILTRMYEAEGWNLGPADEEYAEHPEIRSLSRDARTTGRLDPRRLGCSTWNGVVAATEVGRQPS